MRAKDLLACLAVLAVAGLFLGAVGQPAHAQTAPRVTLTAHAGSVFGTVRDGADRVVAAARLRLRDLTAGRILMTTRGDQEGHFRFSGVPTGSFLVEAVDESGNLLGVGPTFEIVPGQTVATAIRLSARPPWYSGFFTNAAMAAVSSAAGLGVTAVGNGFQPASSRF
jgi:hypothetical protein